jgi:Flp pilus assembly protein TadG
MDAIEMSDDQPPRGALTAFLHDENGTTAAEFALVLPVFLLTVFSTMYLCMLLGAVASLHAATEQAARCLSVNAAKPCTAANINTYAKNLYSGPGITGLNFVTNVSACGNNVTGAGTFSLFTGLGSIGVNVSASACYPII